MKSFNKIICSKIIVILIVLIVPISAKSYNKTDKSDAISTDKLDKGKYLTFVVNFENFLWLSTYMLDQDDATNIFKSSYISLFT